jgi:hypothetical protein
MLKGANFSVSESHGQNHISERPARHLGYRLSESREGGGFPQVRMLGLGRDKRKPNDQAKTRSLWDSARRQQARLDPPT